MREVPECKLAEYLWGYSSDNLYYTVIFPSSFDRQFAKNLSQQIEQFVFKSTKFYLNLLMK